MYNKYLNRNASMMSWGNVLLFWNLQVIVML